MLQVKHPVLSLQWFRSLLWHRFAPWSQGISACCGHGQKKIVCNKEGNYEFHLAGCRGSFAESGVPGAIREGRRKEGVS